MKKIYVISLFVLITLGFGFPVTGDNSGNSSLNNNQNFIDYDQIQLADSKANYDFLNLWNTAKQRNLDLRSSLSYEIADHNFKAPDVKRYFTSADVATDSSGVILDQERDSYCDYYEVSPPSKVPSSEIIVRESPRVVYQAYIIIDGNEDLTYFPGNGTQEDPFVIEGLNFWCPYNLMAVFNTDLYVTIQYNDFHNVDVDGIGLFLNNTEHVTVQHNNFTKNSFGVFANNATDLTVSNNVFQHGVNTGVLVTNSQDFSVSANSISDSVHGVILGESQEGSVQGNAIFDNSGYGVTLWNSDYNLIDGNTIHHNGMDGIFLQDSDSNIISSNEVYSNGFVPDYTETASLRGLSLNNNKLVINAGFFGSAIFLDPSVGNSVVDNVVYDNAGIGVLLEYSNDTVISGNRIFGNDLTGIFFTDSNHNEITGNDVSSNGDIAYLQSMGLNGYDLVRAAGFFGSAIFLDPSYDNVVSGNTLTNNAANGLVLEYSEGTTISKNTISNNGLTGVSFVDSDNNDIVGNVLEGNGVTGQEIAASFASNAFEMKLMAGFFGSAIFLDPSVGNRVSNNVLANNAGVGVYLQSSSETVVEGNSMLDNGAEGVFLEDSSFNTISSNLLSGNGFDDSNYIPSEGLNTESLKLMAGFFGSAIFLDPSPNNTVSNNIVAQNAGSGIFSLESDDNQYTGNSISENGNNGIFFINSDFNLISSNSIDNNGVASDGPVRLNAGFFGSAIFLDPSHGNVVEKNNASGNAEYGVFVESSSGSTIRDNKFELNGLFGVAVDAYSSNTKIAKNNFLNNNKGEKQAYDDGSESEFDNNYWSDHDNTDKNYDGIADEPYLVAGNSGTADTTSNNIKQGLNYYTATQVWTNPRKLNVDSRGHPFIVKIRLADGYRALQLEASKFTINGTVTAVYSEIRDILTIKLVFPRDEINDLVKTWEETCQANQDAAAAEDALQHKDRHDDDHKDKSCRLERAVFEVNGRMNDNLLDLTAFAEVKIQHKHHRSYHWKDVYKWCIAGLSLTPVFPLKKKLKTSPVV